MIGRNGFEFSDSDSQSNESFLSEEPPDEEKSPHSIEINVLTEGIGNPTEEYKNVGKEEIEVMRSKDKNIPRGLAPLEDLFDFDDIAKKPTIEHSDSDVEECNIGTKDKPKMIKLANSLPTDMKKKYIDLFKEFSNVFSWSYEDLKAYDMKIIQHKIPLKENQKPFKQIGRAHV